MTVFVFITYDNLQNIQAERNLPLGVTEIELTNWTKTREPEEIGDGEKKMNSHSDRVELNEGISAEDVESIDGLYKNVKEDGKNYLKLRTIKDVSSSSDITENINVDTDKSESEVSGNKVLRTMINSGNDTQLISYSVDDLYGYLQSDKPIKWDNEGKITWDLHTCVDTQGNLNSIEWRMLSASFEITDKQIRLLQDGNAYAVLGIPADNKYGFELIMPYNNVASVFLNKKTTNINYETRRLLEKQRLNSKDIDYENTSSYTCSNATYHNSLSNHTDGYHIHMEDLSENAGKIKGTLMEMDLEEKLVMGENTIDILIGNFITSDSLKNNSCGFSKINLYIIEMPQMEISMKLYKYKNGKKDGQVVYFDDDYRPTNGDEVYVRIDIQNNSNKYTLKNLGFTKLNTNKNEGTIRLNISPDSFIYNENTITDDIRCYKNGDTSEAYDISALKSLEPGGRITIMSDRLKYTVSKADIINNSIICVGSIRANYIRDELEFINVEKDMKVPISKDCGVLNIKCTIQNGDQDSNNEEKFLVNISSDKGFANLSIKPGHTYSVKNLNISEWHYINLIVPQDYEVVNSTTSKRSIQNKIFLNQQSIENYTGNIEIQLKKKNNPYFYKNKQGKININVLDKSKDL